MAGATLLVLALGGALAADLPPEMLPDAAVLLQQAEPVPTVTVAPAASGVQKHRDFLMEIGFRGRYLSVPDSILDFWYFDKDEDETEQSPLPRPEVRGYTLGMEYAIRKMPANWIFYGEYGGNLLDEGYWDDVEEPPEHDDGDWIEPDGFGLVAFGANYAHEITAAPWLGFQFGGGLGVGIATGSLKQWNHGSDPSNTEPDCLADAPAYERHSSCAADGDKRVPKVVPMVDITASARFNFSDHAHLRLDGGLHEMLYAGMAVGAVF